MVEISEGALKEKHDKGKILIETYAKVRQHQNLSYAEWRAITNKYILPLSLKLRDIYTNQRGTGIIDIAEQNEHNLNSNKAFKEMFWRDCDLGLGLYMELEDPAVRRGFMCADGQIRIDVEEHERYR